MTGSPILLGLDTCGTTGSVALAQTGSGEARLLGEAEIAGGEFAAKLVPCIGEMLRSAGLAATELAGIVAVAGPGSFTGIRVGLAAAKALAEAADVPVVTASRLAVLAQVADAPCAALDAYRGQVYLGVYANGEAREALMTAGEFHAFGPLPGPLAFCEESVAQLLETVANVELARSRAPRAFDAIRFAFERWRSRDFADVATLDGHYLRGADARVSTRQG
jgi:tRNA threonylcarbamoyladenosine biosynthesis protein TsaB